MMQHASTHRPLLAAQPTFTQRIFAAANDRLMPVILSRAASRER